MQHFALLVACLYYASITLEVDKAVSGRGYPLTWDVKVGAHARRCSDLLAVLQRRDRVQNRAKLLLNINSFLAVIVDSLFCFNACVLARVYLILNLLALRSIHFLLLLLYILPDRLLLHLEQVNALIQGVRRQEPFL